VHQGTTPFQQAITATARRSAFEQFADFADT